MSTLRRWRRVVALGRALLLLLACAVGGGAVGAPPRVVAVLYPQTDPPYRQIFADLLAGIEQGLSAETVHARSLPDPPDVAALRRWLDQEAPAVVITLGRVPTATYEHLGLKTPHIVGAEPR